MTVLRSCVILAALLGPCLATSEASLLTVNPIRRVVNMLQGMQTKILEEGKKEEVLFDKFMCYCKTGVGQLEKAIADADVKIPQVESALKSAAAEKAQLEAETKEAQKARAEAKEAIATATALRAKEAAVYAKESGDMKTNLAALAKAIASISKGAGGFLQTSTASVVRELSIDMDISSADRDQIVSFLSGGQGYAPQSGQIVGILKQMKDTMEADLAAATKTEEAALANFDALVAAKEKEIDAATAGIENKLTRVGNLGVEISAMKEDLDDTAKTLLEDKKFLAELQKSCSTKEAEWEARCKLRSEELLALADTIKILNDDDALELFKKTLPGSSLLQVQVSSNQVLKQALTALKSSGHNDYKLDLIALALRGKKVSFEKVIKMIDNMVALLGKEQQDDDDKKEVCEKQIDKAEDDMKGLTIAISDLEKELADTKEEIATLTDEIASLTQGIADLDKQVEEATYNRKEENEDYKSLMANNRAAKDIIGIARNRMNKFYNPKMYVEPKVQVEEGALVSVSSHAFADPGPVPETFGAYSKKSEESNGVLAMMDNLVADLDKEMQEAEVEEKDGQAEYEEFMADAAEKRVMDSKSISDKEGLKADDEAAVQKLTEERQAKMKEAMATMDFLSATHKDCDWLLQNFDLRRDARRGEVDSLKKAKAVLSGADFS